MGGLFGRIWFAGAAEKSLGSLSGRVDRERGCPEGVWCALFLDLVFTFPKDWSPGHTVHADLRGKMTRIAVYWAAEVCSAEATKLPVLEETSGLCGKRILPPQGNWIPGQARDDTVCSLVVLVLETHFHTFHLTQYTS